jgi:predicted TIM-barrel fold metal-dependent hydrolase
MARDLCVRRTTVLDINCGIGNWPFRPTPPADAASMEARLRAEGIARACAYALEAYLWPDPQEANELRLPELVQSPFFIPSAALNPTLPRCLRDYARCRQDWGVPLIRLMPGYHLYELTDPAVDALAVRAAEDGVVLGVHLRADDERMQNPLARVPPVPFQHAVELAARHPSLRVVVFGLARLNEVAFLFSDGTNLVNELAGGPTSAHQAALPDNLWIELSFFEFESSFASALKLFPVERLLFGTHAPLFYPRSNSLKIESSEAPDSAKAAVLRSNARGLLGVDA